MPVAAGPGPGRRAASESRRSRAGSLPSIGPCPVTRSGPRSSTRRRATDAQPRPAVHEARARDHASPRARAGETPTRTSRWRRRSRRRATTRCPRTTSSGRSTAAPAPAAAPTAIERVVYEGYGPGGAAILVEALTDNRNRTGADVRHAFDKHGGSLGEPGSVAWVFEKRGVVLVDASRYSEDDLIAGDRRRRRGRAAPTATRLKVVCAAEDLTAVREALESAGSRDRVGRADHGAEERGRGRTAATPRALMRLMDALDDHDDVEAVHANFDIPAEVLERAAA